MPQDNIKVEVTYYNDEERNTLLQYPMAEAIEQIVAQPIEIPTAEFLTYYLFYKKRLGTPGYRDYYTIGRKIAHALSDLDECIDFNGQSISTPANIERQLIHINWHVGEAIGLSVISRIHGLTDADWSPIDEFRGRGAPPTFDYQMASDGEGFIQVENKGSSVEDNHRLCPAVTTHKSNIKRKKRELQNLGRRGFDPFPANIRYGTISVMDTRTDSIVRCLLLDPEPELWVRNPSSYRLLLRMKFLRDWISFISPRSQLISALATRIVDLEKLRDPFELDRVPLLRRNREPFDFPPINGFGLHTSFMANKSRVKDGPAGGIVVKYSDTALFLIGIREDFIKIVSSQNFEDITAYKAESGTMKKVIECVFSRGRFNRIGIPESLVEVQEEGAYITFDLEGDIHYSSSGLVFGILPIYKNKRGPGRPGPE